MSSPASFARHDAGLFLMRAIVGAVFMFHGAQKLFGVFDGPGIGGFTAGLTQMGIPLPEVSAWLAALAEFGGGLALVLGLATRVVAVPLVITMAVAAFKVHGSAFSLAANGMEYALTLGLVTLGLALTGPGRWSVDAILAQRWDAFGSQRKIEPRRVATS